MNISIAHEGPVAIVTLDRPERRNALSLELMLDLLHISHDPRRRSVRLLSLQIQPCGLAFFVGKVKADESAHDERNAHERHEVDDVFSE